MQTLEKYQLMRDVQESHGYVDEEALNKLNKAFNYAEQIRHKSDIGDDTVLYLQDGQTLSVNYSRDDFPKTLLTFRRTRTEAPKAV